MKAAVVPAVSSSWQIKDVAIPANPRPRAGRRDCRGGPRRHHAKRRRPRRYRLDSIHLRALRMVPAWPQNVLSLSEGHRC